MTHEEFMEQLPFSKGIWMALATINELVNEGFTHEDTNKILLYAVQAHANNVFVGNEKKLN
ncbi:hypothetical protein ACOMCU_25130 [Lysinibacillus sp. UGB7]|uniref:hypothetical protein n=1 Tax=Lysinibacillus sp. UGB7 TaxID=3411039 RepID=UPI003B7A943C